MFGIFIAISVLAIIERWQLHWQLNAGRSNHLMGGWFIASVVAMGLYTMWPTPMLILFSAAQAVAINCLVYTYLGALD